MFENIEGWIIAGVFALAVIAYFVVKVIKIIKMTPDQKKEELKKFVTRAIVLAEAELGAGAGTEKLAFVENFFNTKAPLTYRIILKAVGKDSLKDIIEVALTDIKDNFGGK